MPSDANADTSGRLSRWTQLTEPHTARNCLFSPSVVSDFLSERRPLGITIGGQSLLNKLGLMDMETGRLILNDRSTGVVTLTVVDTLPLAELEGLLELRHVFHVNRVPVSGEIIHLDEDVSLRC